MITSAALMLTILVLGNSALPHITIHASTAVACEVKGQFVIESKNGEINDRVRRVCDCCKKCASKLKKGKANAAIPGLAVEGDVVRRGGEVWEAFMIMCSSTADHEVCYCCLDCEKPYWKANAAIPDY